MRRREPGRGALLHAVRGAAAAPLCRLRRRAADGARFCPQCARPVEPAPGPASVAANPIPSTPAPPRLADKIRAARPVVEGERKQVTVLFADAQGSMELAEQLDAQAWSAIMERFFRILSDGVERFEAFVDKFTGDGIMALFGAPIAHEDRKGINSGAVVVGAGTATTRFDASRARGLTRFVGRDADMATLEAALAQAQAGHGQVVGIVAAAGTGKSRLCWEFAERCRARGLAVNEGHAVAHGRDIPYLPMLEVFRAYFGISDLDRAATPAPKPMLVGTAINGRSISPPAALGADLGLTSR